MEIHYRAFPLDRNILRKTCWKKIMALKKTIGKLYLNHTQLQTIIPEFEVVINSRPLVYVDGDLEIHIIRPNNFLSLNAKNGTHNL